MSTGGSAFAPPTTMARLLASGLKTRIHLLQQGWRVCPSCRALCWPRVRGDKQHACDAARRWNGGFEAVMPMPRGVELKPRDGSNRPLTARVYLWNTKANFDANGATGRVEYLVTCTYHAREAEIDRLLMAYRYTATARLAYPWPSIFAAVDV